MSLFRDVLAQIKANQAKQFNCISWSDKLPRFSAYIPGIVKGRYYSITGAPGSGKTQFTDNLFLCHSVDFAIENNIELEIIYFSFEISKEAKIANLISKRAFETYGVKIPPRLLMKEGKEDPLTENQMIKVAKLTSYFERFERYVRFIDERLTPSQIFKIQMDILKENGTYDHSTSTYTPNNPDKYIMFITDHISLITPDAGQTLHNALATFSSNNIFIKNKFGVTVVSIHQQNVDGQTQQFTNKGENIASKVEPKLETLGDNRTLNRNYDHLKP